MQMRTVRKNQRIGEYSYHRDGIKKTGQQTHTSIFSLINKHCLLVEERKKMTPCQSIDWQGFVFARRTALTALQRFSII
jgi:hypothetical protein